MERNSRYNSRNIQNSPNPSLQLFLIIFKSLEKEFLMLIKSCPGRSPKLDVIRDKRQSTKIVKKDHQMRAQRVTDNSVPRFGSVRFKFIEP